MAAVSISLRRSSRLAHAHSNPTPRRIKSLHPRHQPDPDPDHDSSSSDPENELTPRALRALKRQRLALDPDGLPFASRARPRKRRKENIPNPDIALPPKRPSSIPLTLKRSHSTDSPHSTSAATIPDPIKEPPSFDPAPPPPLQFPSPPMDKPELCIPMSPPSTPEPSTSPEPLTPLTPLTPSPESSPSLPGHDRPPLPVPPPQDPLPSPVSLDNLPPESTPPPLNQHLDSFPPPSPISLDPPLDTLIPFQGLHPQFNPDLSVQVPPPCQPSTPPQLQALELQDHFHSFPQPQLYVPPNPVFVRDRDINIWKLACQERVDCLLRRYGVDYIKALVESEARSVTQEIGSSPGTSPSGHVPPSPTKFRLYTPASYTYSSTSWGSSAATRKTFPADDDTDDSDTAWPMDDTDWVDADVDMEDEDEDDYEDDDDAGEGEAERDGEPSIEAVQGSVIGDASTSKMDAQPAVDDENLAMMAVDESTSASKPAVGSDPPTPPRAPSSTADPAFRPLTQLPHPYLPPMTPTSLPPLSSLHVPLLSEPPRAFMGRGTPPDRRRLIEWSGSGRLAANGMGPPLYLSPVPQRHVNADMGIPMSVDAPVQPQPPHTNGEWTSFLFSMLEGDGVGVGTNVGHPPHASEPTWYELGLGSVATAVPQGALELPLSQHHTHTHGRTPAMEQPVEDGNNSSSTLRFALG